LLALIGIWLFLAVASVSAGAALGGPVGLWRLDRPLDRMMLAFWIGILFLAAFMLFASLFLPLAGYGIALIALAGLAPLFRPATRRMILRDWAERIPALTLLALPVILIVAFHTSQANLQYDGGNYHIPLTRWLADYGTVPGMALGYKRYALVSSWFALPAAFDFGPLFGRSSAVGNGLLFCAAGLQACLFAGRVLAGKGRFSDAFFAIGAGLIIAFGIMPPHFWEWTTSGHPDFAGAFATIAVCWCLLLIAETPQAASWPVQGLRGDPYCLPLLLAAGAFCLKPSFALLAPMAAACFLIRPGNFAKRLAAGVALGIVCISPMILANIVASGCLIYPSGLCLPLPWALTPAEAIAEGNSMRLWNGWDGIQIPPPPDGKYWDWVEPWLLALDARFWSLRLFFGAALALLPLAALHAAGLWQKSRSIAGYALLAYAVMGIVVVFVSMPGPRPLFGFMLVLAGLGLARPANAVLSQLGALLPLRPVSFQLLLLLGVSLGIFAADRQYSSSSPVVLAYDRAIRAGQLPPFSSGLERLLVPDAAMAVQLNWSDFARPITPQQLLPTPMNDFTYNRVAHGNLCWAAPQPCFPFGSEHMLRLRNPAAGIAGGFVRVN